MPDKNHEKNRAVWNEIVGIHYRHPSYQVKEFLNGRGSLKSIELDEVGDVNGRRLLHLMCQFGLDTLSWARRGARVTGVDISDNSIEYAQQLAKKTGLKANFIRSDVIDLPRDLNGTFDIVFQSYGTHHWLSNLDRWAAVVARHLKPGGIFYMVDLHPISALWEDESISYFKRGPYVYRDETDYCDKDYKIKNEQVEYQHKLAEIVTAVIRAGLEIEFLHEFQDCCYPRERDWIEKDGYFRSPSGRSRYPQLFSIRAHKASS